MHGKNAIIKNTRVHLFVATITEEVLQNLELFEEGGPMMKAVVHLLAQIVHDM